MPTCDNLSRNIGPEYKQYNLLKRGNMAEAINIASSRLNLQGQNLLSTESLSRQQIEKLIESSYRFKANPHQPVLNNSLMASCFFEPSTRTRFSFEAAMYRLGGKVINLSESEGLSTAKGESIVDTFKVIASYVDILLIRHPDKFITEKIAQFSQIPIINCGNGSDEHPTQALLDIFTIHETQNNLDNLNIALIGDLKHGRTINSLIKILRHFNVTFYFFPYENLGLSDSIYQLLEKYGLNFVQPNSIYEVLPMLDIIYFTRVQKERMQSPNVKTESFDIDCILNKAKPNLKLLHPLPRLTELPNHIDTHPASYYFQQAANGVPVRQAIIYAILQQKKHRNII